MLSLEINNIEIKIQQSFVLSTQRVEKFSYEPTQILSLSIQKQTNITKRRSSGFTRPKTFRHSALILKKESSWPNIG